MEETINSTPLQKTIEEADILHHILLEARPISPIIEQECMEIYFSKEDPILGRLPIHIDEDVGNNAVMSRVYLEPHAEEEGALAPTRGIIVSLQGIP